MPVDIIEGHYNLSSIINSSSLGSLTSNIAPIMGGYYLGLAFLLIIYLVTFLYLIGLKSYKPSACSLAALTLTLTSSWLLLAMGIISATYMWWIVFLWLVQFLFIALADEFS